MWRRVCFSERTATYLVALALLVLEPSQSEPVIIEDDCFIGARSEVAEGVIVEQGSVLSQTVEDLGKLPFTYLGEVRGQEDISIRRLVDRAASEPHQSGRRRQAP